MPDTKESLQAEAVRLIGVAVERAAFGFGCMECARRALQRRLDEEIRAAASDEIAPRRCGHCTEYGPDLPRNWHAAMVRAVNQVIEQRDKMLAAQGGYKNESDFDRNMKASIRAARGVKEALTAHAPEEGERPDLYVGRVRRVVASSAAPPGEPSQWWEMGRMAAMSAIEKMVMGQRKVVSPERH